jgi:hypothetical protein
MWKDDQQQQYAKQFRAINKLAGNTKSMKEIAEDLEILCCDQF